jgi:hypothetical protein
MCASRPLLWQTPISKKIEKPYILCLEDGLGFFHRVGRRLMQHACGFFHQIEVRQANQQEKRFSDELSTKELCGLVELLY